jgi:hypothetical protein
MPPPVIPSKPSALPDFLPCGKASQDTPAEAAARAEQDHIRREHRVKRRSGAVLAPTPSLESIMARKVDLPTSNIKSSSTVVSSKSATPQSTQSNIVVQVPVHATIQPTRLTTPASPKGAVFTPYEENPSPLLICRPSIPSLRGRGRQIGHQVAGTPSGSRRASIVPIPSIHSEVASDPSLDEMLDNKAF